MYDIKRIEYYVNHPEEIKISKNWMNVILDCTPKGRKFCKGKCCYDHGDKKDKGIFVRYTDDEVKKLPKSFKKHIKDNNVVKVDKDGKCELINLCMKYPKYKPIECKLIPLTIDKRGLLQIYVGSLSGCPNLNRGKTPVYIAMKDNLIDLFGEEFYKRLENKMKTDNNSVDKYM